MNNIKTRRLSRLTLDSHPGLCVGMCVPFYFCPRSIMLYLLHQANHPNLSYRGGQSQIVHLEADLHNSVAWAQESGRRWAFTLSNAGALYFEDRAHLSHLHELNWAAIKTDHWSGNGIDRSVKEGKQAEFLMERDFPWHLVERIGVYSKAVFERALNSMPVNRYRPVVEIKASWYY